MALFQPTNIIPSSFTQGTVDAVKDNMEISWQVNGNSAMTAFQIDFYLNDSASTFVYSLGKITSYSFTNESGQTLSLPFYGTDRFGRPQFFTYNANGSWNEKNSGFTNGNNYKFKITQFWNEGEIYEVAPTIALIVGNSYYFSLVNQSGQTIYIRFISSDTISPPGYKLRYNINQNTLDIVNRGDILTPVPSPTTSTSIPTVGTNAGVATNEKSVEQSSFSSFNTRSIPTLALKQTDENYLNPITLPNTLTTSKGYFYADYVQAQGDPIRWVRWQIATANNGVVGDILVDTGDVYTPTLNFEFNGFFNNKSYAIRCFGESESGQATELQGANSDGWIIFNINYVANTYDGNFTVQCLNKENAALLEWEGVEVINGNYTYPEGSEGKYSFQNNAVVLLPNSLITWNKQGSNDMNFPESWTAVWRGIITQTLAQVIGFNPIQRLMAGQGFLLKYSPDGELLLYYDENNRQILVYSVAATELTLRGYLLSNGTITTAPTEYSAGLVTDMVFSNNGLFAVSTTSNLFLHAYSNGNFSLLVSNNVGGRSLAFSPSGNILVQGSDGTKGTTVYSIVSNTLNPLYTLQRDGRELRVNITAIDFNTDGTIMCMCSNTSSTAQTSFRAWVFTVNGNQIIYREDLPINAECYNLAFNKGASPNTLVVAGYYSYVQCIVTDDKVELTRNITNAPATPFPISRAIAFSSNGKDLLLGGESGVNWYSIENNHLIYKNQLSKEAWNVATAIAWNPTINQIAIHNNGSNNFNQVFNVAYSIPGYLAKGKLFNLQLGEEAQQINIILNATGNSLTLNKETDPLGSFTYPPETTSTAIVITPTTANAYFYNENGLISQSSIPINYTQQPITSVSIYGGENGATIDSVSVYQGGGSNILSLYENPDFEPVWNDSNYELYMTANFNGNIQGGTGNAEGGGFQVYRREVGGSVLTPIANVSASTTSIKDYGIRSRKAYEYLLGVYDSNNAFMGLVTAQNTIATCFKNYSLLVCDYDETKDEYHVRKQYIFALNLSNGSVGNNNSPTLNKNFTRFPTRMPDTANYKRGTLSGLIGAIYTVPALIEQIGQYKYTAKPSTLDYFDSVDLEEELYELSTAPYQLFLRDMKGHLRMISTDKEITMTTNIKQKQQSISISFPWVEIGDASDVTIIQTPDDYGWNNDNQVLDVQLDVDVATGELSATYPFPYNGTKFYLTGVNKENLIAKTPPGITPAQFELSEVAEEPNDGEVTTTVKVNTENN